MVVRLFTQEDFVAESNPSEFAVDTKQSLLGGRGVDYSVCARHTRVMRAELAFGDDPLYAPFALTAAALHSGCFGLIAAPANVEDGVSLGVPRTGSPLTGAIRTRPVICLATGLIRGGSLAPLYFEGSNWVEIFVNAILELEDAEGTIALLPPIPLSHPI